MRTATVLAAAILAFAAGRAPAGAGDDETHLAFLGDTGTGGSAQREVAARLHAWAAGLAAAGKAPWSIFLLGDNIYGSGQPSRFRSRFDDIYRATLALGIPFRAALGNHDVRHCVVARAGALPSDAGAYEAKDDCHVAQHLRHAPFGYAEGRRYYSVASPARDGAPLVEVFVLDANTLDVERRKPPGVDADPEQLRWLGAALGDSRARWKVVALHNPPHGPKGKGYWYLLGRGGHAPDRGLARQLDGLLTGRVDVLFAGHSHFYARTQRAADGVRYFVSGGGGQRIYGFKTVEGEPQVASGGKLHHFVAVRVTPGVFEYRTIDREGRVKDSGCFRKEDPKDTPLHDGVCPLGS